MKVVTKTMWYHLWKQTLCSERVVWSRINASWTPTNILTESTFLHHHFTFLFHGLQSHVLEILLNANLLTDVLLALHLGETRLHVPVVFLIDMTVSVMSRIEKIYGLAYICNLSFCLRFLLALPWFIVAEDGLYMCRIILFIITIIDETIHIRVFLLFRVIVIIISSCKIEFLFVKINRSSYI